MKRGTRGVWMALVAVVLSVVPVHAQIVTFSDFNDAVPGRLFDAKTSAPDPFNPNKLNIGFNAGIDPRTWKSNAFTASTTGFYYTTAMDTISFRVEAPAGFYVSKITYIQKGTGSISRVAYAAGAAHWVVDDAADALGVYGANPTLTRTADLTGDYRTLVSVSITSSMFTFAAPLAGSASMSLTSANVLVEVEPLPVHETVEPAVEAAPDLLEPSLTR
jgi:hypothetical protein